MLGGTHCIHRASTENSREQRHGREGGSSCEAQALGGAARRPSPIVKGRTPDHCFASALALRNAASPASDTSTHLVFGAASAA